MRGAEEGGRSQELRGRDSTLTMQTEHSTKITFSHNLLTLAGSAASKGRFLTRSSASEGRFVWWYGESHHVELDVKSAGPSSTNATKMEADVESAGPSSVHGNAYPSQASSRRASPYSS